MTICFPWKKSGYARRSSVVVATRLAVWASSEVRPRPATRTERASLLRKRSPTHAGEHHAKRKEEQTARDQTARTVMDRGDESCGAFGVLHDPVPEEYSIQDTRERPAGDQARAEERSGSNFRLFGVSGFLLDVRAQQTA